jgi:general stress protein 26
MSDRQELWDLIEDFHFCMATTHQGGSMRSRPMSPYVDKNAGVIHFLADAGAPMADQIQADQDINLAFIAPKDKNFISLSGTAGVSQDQAIIKDLWNPTAEAWFPGGPGTVALITVTPTTAELWDGESSKIKTMWEMAKARRKDEKPDVTEHKKMSL